MELDMFYIGWQHDSGRTSELDHSELDLQCFGRDTHNKTIILYYCISWYVTVLFTTSSCKQ